MTDSPRARRARIASRRKVASQHLAYDIWHYEKPNPGAIEHAASTIAVVVEALEYAGLVLVEEAP